MGSLEIEISSYERNESTVEEVPTIRKRTRSAVKKTNTAPAPVKHHPPYKKMIIEAINGTKKSTTCSWYAIAKNIREKYIKILPYNFNKTLFKELRDLTEKGVLVRTKNSFKFAHGFNKATKSHANPVSVSLHAKASLQAKFPIRARKVSTPARSFKMGDAETSTIHGEIDKDADNAESDGVESIQDARVMREVGCINEASGSGSKVFIFKGTVQNAHFH